MASPIEDMLRAALLRIDGPLRSRASWLLDCTGKTRELRDGYIEPSAWYDDERHEQTVYVYRGVTVLSYRADFVLEFGVRKLAIECDGHEFHDRTKQQAAYDRSRDRELMRLGLATIRFTGSEIVHSAERCADEAYRCLLALPDTRAIFNEAWRESVVFYEMLLARESSVEEHW